MSKALGQEIGDARRRLRKTLRSVAREIHVSAALLSLIEQGKHVPSREVIAKLAGHLDGDPDRWCGMAGRITSEAEATMADLAKEQPQFFRFLRSMVERHGAR